MITALCINQNQPDKVQDALNIMNDELAQSVARGRDRDDYKSASGGFYTRVRRLLGLTDEGIPAPSDGRDTRRRVLLVTRAVGGGLGLRPSPARRRARGVRRTLRKVAA